MGISILGTHHTKFGRLNKTLYDLIIESGRGAIEDAGIEAKDIDSIWVGNLSGGGFNNQEHIAPFTMNIHKDLRFTPATHVENACASGSAAIECAKQAIESGNSKIALVIGVEKMNDLDTKGVTKVLAMSSYWPDEGSKGITFPGLFAEYAKGYMKHYNYSLDKLRAILAKISAKNHTNAVENPLAQMPLKITAEEILNKPDEKNPIVYDPLRLFDCSLVTDGAAALVLTTSEIAKSIKNEVVEIAALSHTTDYLSIFKRSNYELTAGKLAVKKAFKKAGITLDDLDFAEVHDCFTINELLSYEALGIAPDGEGYRALDEGIVYPEGKLPVNLSGGLKAKGHPVGATGVSMAVLATRQLLGKAIGIQAKDAEIGLTFNVGGSAASNYALVFKRTK
ncbi:thiolase domain-containing protein [Proteiniborus sp.]|uniref:thiolase domain-containing protein n=1 Tax=Proteiniborus sp. TaxID=2079015 RepID=UPI00332ABC86